MGFFTNLRALPLRLGLLLACMQTCQASMYAWLTTIGPQILLQNSTTGEIMYSDCNSYSTPIYSYNKSLSLSYKPKNGTAVAGTGWWNNQNTVGHIWYQDEEHHIIYTQLQCDMNTGKFNTVNSWNISGDAPSVNNETGLAGLVLSSTAGYRVYFHDKDQAVNQIVYTNEEGWKYDRVISHANPPTSAIHAHFHDTKNLNISVVTPFDAKNFEITRWNTDKSWHVTTAPTPLNGNLTTDADNRTDISISTSFPANFSMPYWTGQQASIGISTDSAKSRSVWYMGTDSSLYQVTNKNFMWFNAPNQSTDYWPKADSPNAEFAVTSSADTSEVHVYYFVKGLLTEVKFSDGSWQPWAALATFNSTPKATDSNNSTNTGAGSDNGLSSGAKAGIGVGVSLGVFAIGGTALALLFFRRRAVRQEADEKAAAEMANSQSQHGTYSDYSSHPPYGSPPPTGSWPQEYKTGYAGYRGSEMDTNPSAMEMETPRPVYELADQTFSHELIGSGAPSPVPTSAQQVSPLLQDQKLAQSYPEQPQPQQQNQHYHQG